MMVEMYNADGMPNDHELRSAMERANNQFQALQSALEYNLVTVQLVYDNDRMNVALVAHNPCDLNQYQVVAFLPTMDNSLDTLKANEAAGKEVAKFEDEMPDEVMESVMELCIKRFAHASTQDPEAFIRISAAPTFEAARAVYQEYYGLTEGGDFNHPLK